MIYTPRGTTTNQTNTKIVFRGFEISIAMDDRCLGGHLTRSMLAVYKDDQEVTHQFAESHNIVQGSILDVEGETLFKIMQAIAKKDPGGPIRLPDGDGIIDHSGGDDPGFVPHGPNRCP